MDVGYDDINQLLDMTCMKEDVMKEVYDMIFGPKVGHVKRFKLALQNKKPETVMNQTGCLSSGLEQRQGNEMVNFDFFIIFLNFYGWWVFWQFVFCGQ